MKKEEKCTIVRWGVNERKKAVEELKVCTRNADNRDIKPIERDKIKKKNVSLLTNKNRVRKKIKTKTRKYRRQKYKTVI